MSKLIFATPMGGVNIITIETRPPGKTINKRSGTQGKQNGLPIQMSNGIIPEI